MWDGVIGWRLRPQRQSNWIRKGFWSRKIDLRRLIATLFTVVGAGEYGLAITLIIIYGFWGASFLFGLATALVLMAVLVPRIWLSKKHMSSCLPSYGGYKSLTTPDFLYFKFGRACSVMATIVTALAFWGLVVLQFVVGGELLAALTGTPVILNVLLMMGVITAYTILGGFSAIFYTDFWQKIFMWVGLLIVVSYLAVSVGNTVEMSNAISDFWTRTQNSIRLSNLLSDPNIVVLFFITVAAAFGGPDLWQRANLAKTKKEAVSGLAWTAVSLVLFTCLLSLLTIDIIRVHASMSDTSEPFVAYIGLVSGGGTAEQAWPQWLLLVFSIGMLSAFVSTADTSLMLVVSSVVNEYHRECRNSEKNVGEVSMKTQATVLLGVSLSAGVFAIATPNVAKTFIAVLGILGVMGIPVFFSLFNIGNRMTCFLAMSLGVAIVLAANYLLPGKYNDGYYLLLPFVPGLCSLVTVFNNRKVGEENYESK